MPPAVVLEACPICRAALDGAPQECPACGSDLSPYLDLVRRSGELVALAREKLARGESEPAREIVAHLTQLVSDPGPEFYALWTELALEEGRVEDARRHAAQAGAAGQELLERLVELRSGEPELVREQYNYALTAARAGRYEVARRHLVAALEAAPQDEQLWNLKLKVDLKRSAWAEVYDDLAALDRLSARPEEFAGLEKLLPVLPPLHG